MPLRSPPRERVAGEEGLPLYTSLRETHQSLPACHQHAVEALGRLRLMLGTARRSPDAAARFDSSTRSNAARQRQAAHAMWAALGYSASPSAEAITRQLPPPAHFFTCMGTAPPATLWLTPASTREEREAERTADGDEEERRAMAAAARERPVWNASTLLHDEDAGHGPATSRAVPMFTSRRTAAELRPSPGHVDPTAEGTSKPAAVDASLPRNGRPGPSAADVAKEAAVRDYLRRLNILGSDTPTSVSASPLDSVAAAGSAVPSSSSEGTEPYGDALFNGAALCQLARWVLLDRSAPVTNDPVPCRRPQSLMDVRRNYMAALAALSDSTLAGLTLPPECFRLTPEEVYLRGHPSKLLALFVAIIAQLLPPPERVTEGPQGSLRMWQPPADAAVYESDCATPAGADALRAAEVAACEALYTFGVLPDVAVYALPTDECLVPGPLAAPYVAAFAGAGGGSSLGGPLASRVKPPAALYTPSVFPFLTNGVALCGLARHLTGSGVPATPFLIPKTRSNCLKNIRAALAAVADATGASLPPSLDEDIFRGHRRRIVALLDVMVRALNHASDVLTEATTLDHESRKHYSRSSSNVGSGSGSAVAVPRGAPRTRTTAVPLAAYPPPPPPTLRAPLASSVPASASATATAGAAVGLSPRERDQLCAWVTTALGPGFHYTAEDDSFDFLSDGFTITDPCLVFSDGVVLAHLIRALECRRCDDLECVRPTSKRPAKRFNVRRCLQFLQKERGAVMPVPLLDERLLAGEPVSVLRLLKCMRGRYRGA